MKNGLIYSVAASALLAGALAAGPAAADVVVHATITKTKDITVVETIAIAKAVQIIVIGNFTDLLKGTAETDALANVTNDNHQVKGTDPVPVVTDTTHDDGNEAHALIDNSLGFTGGNTGVIGLNQSAGNFVNQGNIVSVGIIADGPKAFANAQAATDQKNRGNLVLADEGVCAPGDNDNCFDNDLANPNLPGLLYHRRTADIIAAINGNSGVVDVNQDAGNMNNQTNTDAISVALGGILALAEGDLGQVNTGNSVFEAETVRQDTIVGSINGNTGIIKVNQSTGNMNNQANNVAFAALSVQANITPPTAFTKF